MACRPPILLCGIGPGSSSLDRLSTSTPPFTRQQPRCPLFRLRFTIVLSSFIAVGATLVVVLLWYQHEPDLHASSSTARHRVNQSNEELCINDHFELLKVIHSGPPQRGFAQGLESLVRRVLNVSTVSGEDHFVQVSLMINGAGEHSYMPAISKKSGLPGEPASAAWPAGSRLSLSFLANASGDGAQAASPPPRYLTFVGLGHGGGAGAGACVERLSVAGLTEPRLAPGSGIRLARTGGGGTEIRFVRGGGGHPTVATAAAAAATGPVAGGWWRHAVSLQMEGPAAHAEVAFGPPPPLSNGPCALAVLAGPPLCCGAVAMYAAEAQPGSAAGIEVRVGRAETLAPVVPEKGGLVVLFEEVRKRAMAETAKMFPALTLAIGDAEVRAPPNSAFREWLASQGAVVKKGDPIANVQGAGSAVHILRAIQDGVLKSRQERLKRGMAIDSTVVDRVVAVIGAFRPLKVFSGEVAAVVPPGSIFKAYKVAKGSYVRKDDPIALYSDTGGTQHTLTAPAPGIVVALQKDLRPDMNIDDALLNANVATIGKLPLLQAGIGEKLVQAPVEVMLFKEWRATVGDILSRGDPVAVLQDTSGRERIVPSPKYGTVKSRQESLRPGYNIGEVTEKRDLAVIGKFPKLQIGFLQRGVEAPVNVIFGRWLVKEGDTVAQGDAVAEMVMPVRRLAAGGSVTIQGDETNISATTSGYISHRQPLQQGQILGDVQEGTTIATIYEGWPMWPCLLMLCVALWCCFFWLFKVMKKPAPIYDTLVLDIPPEVPDPQKQRTMTPAKRDGLRLVFEHRDANGRGIVTTAVYAQRRPLGILHNHQAPIVVHGFTVNSYAKVDLGVQPEWKLVRIGNVALNDSLSFETINDTLTNYMKAFPIYPLAVTFRVDNESMREEKVYLSERPLGIQFTNEAPIQVCKVFPGSHAKTQKIEEGWTIVQIGEMDVRENTDFNAVMDYLIQGVKALDDNKRRYNPSTH